MVIEIILRNMFMHKVMKDNTIAEAEQSIGNIDICDSSCTFIFLGQQGDIVLFRNDEIGYL